ncbi:putative membrane protein [Desulfitispora alkaliphila]|uniref:SHOCT domain-containing protein n=1 Tax=Desulfitispora alkaliphila TaxID=622674 RepID=UPI003D1B5A4B
MMHWGYGYGMGFGTILMWAFMIGIIVLVGYGISGFLKKDSETNDALKILQERFAKGEINEEEYKHKRDLLERN